MKFYFKWNWFILGLNFLCFLVKVVWLKMFMRDVLKLNFIISFLFLFFFSSWKLYCQKNIPWYLLIYTWTVFNIVTTDTETFVVMCNQFGKKKNSGKTLCPVVRGLRVIVLEVMSKEYTFQCRKWLKVQWGKIETENQMIQSLPFRVTILILCGPCYVAVRLSPRPCIESHTLGTSLPKHCWGGVDCMTILCLAGHWVLLEIFFQND